MEKRVPLYEITVSCIQLVYNLKVNYQITGNSDFVQNKILVFQTSTMEIYFTPIVYVS